MACPAFHLNTQTQPVADAADGMLLSFQVNPLAPRPTEKPTLDPAENFIPFEVEEFLEPDPDPDGSRRDPDPDGDSVLVPEPTIATKNFDPIQPPLQPLNAPPLFDDFGVLAPVATPAAHTPTAPSAQGGNLIFDLLPIAIILWAVTS